jgi:hypothetical protein
MANSITNISEITSVVELENERELTYAEKLQKMDRIKQNLGFLYFTVLVILMTSLVLY